MHFRIAVTVALASIFMLTTIGCVTSGESSGGWVVVGQPDSTPPPPPPPPSRHPSPSPKYKKDNYGQDRAARNHIRSAYRFLEKNKPDHALRELDKARDRVGADFWFYYYRGGAYYFKGMYGEASDSWRVANRHTKDHRLLSRLRTCRSFAVHHLEGDEKSIDLLRRAIDLDEKNREARELLKDLVGSMERPYERKSEPKVGFMRPSDNKTRADNGNEDGEDREYNDDETYESGRSKGHKGQAKDDRRYRKPEIKRKKLKKIRGKERFRKYFLIEVP